MFDGKTGSKTHETVPFQGISPPLLSTQSDALMSDACILFGLMHLYIVPVRCIFAAVKYIHILRQSDVPLNSLQSDLYPVIVKCISGYK